MDTSLLIYIIVHALTVFVCVEIIRAVPPFEYWWQAHKKPWSCNLCMSLWTSLLVVFVAVFVVRDYSWLTSAGPGMGLGLILLRRFGRRPPVPDILGKET